MRKVLLFLVLTSILFQSCQKNVTDKLPEETTVSSDDPAKLSAAIRVWHGQRTTGNMPASTGTLPEIDPLVNPEVKAFAGRYAIIKPEVLDGTVAGYYVGIAGAGQYFKVDYTKPRDIAGRNGILNPVKGTKGGSLTGRLLDIQDGTADSSIVIVLPPNIQVPDTFCVTYYPYDAQGNIGQGVTTCIIVAALGTDANSAWLQNVWKITSSWEIINGVYTNFDTIIYNKWTKYYGDGYGCYVTSSGNILDHTYAGGPATLVNDSIFYRKYHFRFATDGATDIESDIDDKFLNVPLSTCSQFVFRPVTTDQGVFSGGYTYNAVTGQLLLIIDFDEWGLPEPQVFEFTIVKISNTHLLLKDLSYAGYEYIYRLQR